MNSQNEDKFPYYLQSNGKETGIEIFCQEVLWMRLMNTVTCEVINKGNKRRYSLKPNKSVFIPISPSIDYEVKVGVAQAIFNNLTFVAKTKVSLESGEIQCYQYIPPVTSLHTAKLLREKMVRTNEEIAANEENAGDSRILASATSSGSDNRAVVVDTSKRTGLIILGAVCFIILICCLCLIFSYFIGNGIVAQ